jgi:Fic family protein
VGNILTAVQWIDVLKAVNEDIQIFEAKNGITLNMAAPQWAQRLNSGRIYDNVTDYQINRMFVSELHKMTVKTLFQPPEDEWDPTPGIQEFMDGLFDFINQEHPQKYDLLKIAIVHHRFMWIHPFRNGNGRTGRLLTYALLVKLGFNVKIGHILNPTAIFCNDRNQYYENLTFADSGSDDGILAWCTYVLQGLLIEIEKIDRLLNYNYLQKEILLPAIHISIDNQIITDLESKILKRAVDRQVIQASDLTDLLPGKAPSEVTRVINRLKKKKMLMAEKENGRKYVIRFDNNYLLRAIMRKLDEKGFLPVKD